MNTKNILSITEARKNIFALADAVQAKNSTSTLTERGKARMVMLSAKSYDALVEKQASAFLLSDGNQNNYDCHAPRQWFSKTLIIRDESRVVYLSSNDQKSKDVEENLIKAQLFVQLIEKYHYPLHLVELGRYVKIGSTESRHYIEADILINDEKGNVGIIFEVSPFLDYEENMDYVVADLFALADSVSWVKKPRYLVYYSRSAKNGVVKEKTLTVACTKFNTFSAWKKAGRPGTKTIPEFEKK